MSCEASPISPQKTKKQNWKKKHKNTQKPPKKERKRKKKKKLRKKKSKNKDVILNNTKYKYQSSLLNLTF